jgi:hypothetical protein
MRAPRRMKLGAAGQYGQHPGCGGLVQEEAEDLQRRGVRPVQVFPDREHRRPLRLREQPGNQGLVGFLPLPLGAQVQRWVVCRVWQHQQRGQERHDLCTRQAGCLQAPLQLGQLRLGIFIPAEL